MCEAQVGPIGNQGTCPVCRLTRPRRSRPGGGSSRAERPPPCRGCLRCAGVAVGPARRWSTRPAFVVARASPRRLHGPCSARKPRLSRVLASAPTPFPAIGLLCHGAMSRLGRRRLSLFLRCHNTSSAIATSSGQAAVQLGIDAAGSPSADLAFRAGWRDGNTAANNPQTGCPRPLPARPRGPKQADSNPQKTTHYQRQPSVPPAGLEPAISCVKVGPFRRAELPDYQDFLALGAGVSRRLKLPVFAVDYGSFRQQIGVRCLFDREAYGHADDRQAGHDAWAA